MDYNQAYLFVIEDKPAKKTEKLAKKELKNQDGFTVPSWKPTEEHVKEGGRIEGKRLTKVRTRKYLVGFNDMVYFISIFSNNSGGQKFKVKETTDLVSPSMACRWSSLLGLYMVVPLHVHGSDSFLSVQISS